MSSELSVEATTPVVPGVDTEAVLVIMPGSEACCAFSWVVCATSQGSEKSGYCGGDWAKAGAIANATAKLATPPRTRFFLSIFVSFGLGSRRVVVAGHPKEETSWNFRCSGPSRHRSAALHPRARWCKRG